MAGSDSPVVFEPIFKERIWVVITLPCRLARNCLPTNQSASHGRSSIDPKPKVSCAKVRWPADRFTISRVNFREKLFGVVPDAPRFPLLIKLLDAQEKLSLQVHPPPEIAESLGGEAKTEFWYVFAAEPNAEIFVGLRKSMTRDQFEDAHSFRNCCRLCSRDPDEER